MDNILFRGMHGLRNMMFEATQVVCIPQKNMLTLWSVLVQVHAGRAADGGEDDTRG